MTKRLYLIGIVIIVLLVGQCILSVLIGPSRPLTFSLEIIQILGITMILTLILNALVAMKYYSEKKLWLPFVGSILVGISYPVLSAQRFFATSIDLDPEWTEFSFDLVIYSSIFYGAALLISKARLKRWLMVYGLAILFSWSLVLLLIYEPGMVHQFAVFIEYFVEIIPLFLLLQYLAELKDIKN
ncbi:hypothetical protein JYT25_00325 [bacterium AH-315-C20]|nr:hypothetical protein [bacterium AH-315-C20]